VLRLFFIAWLIAGSAMATDNQKPRGVLGGDDLMEGIQKGTEPSKIEMYRRSPQGIDSKMFVDRVKRGELTIEEATKQYREKWNIAPDRKALPGLNNSWDR
jgi:hypothetical protein